MGGWLVCHIVLVSAIHQHESATDTHISPLRWTSLPSPTPSHPSRLSQSPGLSSRGRTASSHWLSVLWYCDTVQQYVITCTAYDTVYVSVLLSPSISPSPASLLPLSTSLFSMPASPLLPGALKKNYFLAKPRGIWDLSSPIKDQTSSFCIGSVESQPLNQKGAPSAFVHFKPKFVHSEGY